MSPVSPVFHTVARVNIDLKNIPRVGTFILEYREKAVEAVDRKEGCQERTITLTPFRWK